MTRCDDRARWYVGNRFSHVHDHHDVIVEKRDGFRAVVIRGPAQRTGTETELFAKCERRTVQVEGGIWIGLLDVARQGVPVFRLGQPSAAGGAEPVVRLVSPPWQRNPAPVPAYAFSARADERRVLALLVRNLQVVRQPEFLTLVEVDATGECQHGQRRRPCTVEPDLRIVFA